MKTPLSALLLIAASTLSAPAMLFWTETFGFPNGDLKTAVGSSWVSHGGGTTPLNVVGGAAFIDQNDATGGRDDYNRPLGVSFDPALDNTTQLFAAFTVNFSALPFLGGTAVNGSYFAHFKSSAASEFYARIGATTTGAAPGNFRVGIANEAGFSSANPTFVAQDLSLNTTYLLVAMLDLATDKATLWINPTTLTDPSVTATDGISYSVGAINAFALRQGTSGTSPNTGAPGDILIDNLRVGTSFAEVVPEPSTFALALAGAAGLLALRRRR